MPIKILAPGKLAVSARDMRLFGPWLRPLPLPAVNEDSWVRPKPEGGGRMLPARFVSLDIETNKTHLRSPERCTLALAGIATHRRVRNDYKYEGYRAFEVQELPELTRVLSQFSGPIVGLNLFAFDYRVLAQYMPLDSIVPKTKDLRALLLPYAKDGRFRLSLEALSQENLGRGKSEHSGSVPELWRKGEKAKVRRHNRTDCRLAANLWLRLVLDREFYLPSKFENDELAYYPHCEVEAKLWNLLVSRTHLSHAQWQRRLAHWGNALRPRTKVFVHEADAGRNPRFGCSRCISCKKTLGLITRPHREFGDRERTRCPVCGHSTLMGYRFVELTPDGWDARSGLKKLLSTNDDELRFLHGGKTLHWEY